MNHRIKSSCGARLLCRAIATSLGLLVLTLAGAASATVDLSLGAGGGVVGGSVHGEAFVADAGVGVPVAEKVEIGGRGFLIVGGIGEDMSAVTGDGRYDLPRPWEWLRPSLNGGVGWYRVENCPLLFGKCEDHDGVGFNLGGGLDVPVYRELVTVGVDARWHHAFVPGGIDAGTALLNLGLHLD